MLNTRALLRVLCMAGEASLWKPQGTAFTASLCAGSHELQQARRLQMCANTPAGAPSCGRGLYFGAGGAMDKRLAKVETEVQRSCADSALVLIDGILCVARLSAGRV